MLDVLCWAGCSSASCSVGRLVCFWQLTVQRRGTTLPPASLTQSLQSYYPAASRILHMSVGAYLCTCSSPAPTQAAGQVGAGPAAATTLPVPLIPSLFLQCLPSTNIMQQEHPHRQMYSCICCILTCRPAAPTRAASETAAGPAAAASLSVGCGAL